MMHVGDVTYVTTLKITMLDPSYCGYRDAHIRAKGTITVSNTAVADVYVNNTIEEVHQ